MRSHFLGLVWIELQSVLSLCVLFFAVGIKLIFHTFEEEQQLRDEYLMCSFASISLVLMYSMSLMHRGFDYNFHGTGRRLIYHTVFYTVAIWIGLIPFFATSSTFSIVLLHVSTTVLVFQDIFNRALRMRALHMRGDDLSQENASKAWVSAMDSSVSSDVFNFGSDSFGRGSRSGSSMGGSGREGMKEVPLSMRNIQLKREQEKKENSLVKASNE